MTTYYSQYGQDRFLRFVFFRSNRKGFFLDIGAHDGVTYSNSCYFERALGWTGVCVEPIPDVFERLQKSRNCQLINACISNQNGDVPFTRIHGYSEMLSGITSQYDARHWERIHHEIEAEGGSIQQLTIPCLSVQQLFDNAQIKQIDFCSIDTEGNELPILRAFPFSSCKPTVFLVENNYKSNEIHQLLTEKGYVRILRLGDDVYHFGKLSLKQQFLIWIFRVQRKLKRILS